MFAVRKCVVDETRLSLSLWVSGIAGACRDGSRYAGIDRRGRRKDLKEEVEEQQ